MKINYLIGILVFSFIIFRKRWKRGFQLTMSCASQIMFYTIYDNQDSFLFTLYRVVGKITIDEGVTVHIMKLHIRKRTRWLKGYKLKEREKKRRSISVGLF